MACRSAAAELLASALLGCLASGCAEPNPSFEQLRTEGLRLMIAGRYAGARGLFVEAYKQRPEDAYNLHDLGDCCVFFARDQFEQMNVPAAHRELDKAVEYYSRSINSYPGFEPALIGKNHALELKGESEKALALAEWARKYVGPSARQQIFLAREFEQRGDVDSAELRYRQGVAMEQDSALANAELGKFYCRQNLPDRGRPYLERAYALDPHTPGVASMVRPGGDAR
jgi:tetratricopeptide (TPR) repeat protein